MEKEKEKVPSPSYSIYGSTWKGKPGEKSFKEKVLASLKEAKKSLKVG